VDRENPARIRESMAASLEIDPFRIEAIPFIHRDAPRNHRVLILWRNGTLRGLLCKASAC
jgi:hypothetical protein